VLRKRNRAIRKVKEEGLLIRYTKKMAGISLKDIAVFCEKPLKSIYAYKIFVERF